MQGYRTIEVLGEPHAPAPTVEGGSDTRDPTASEDPEAIATPAEG